MRVISAVAMVEALDADHVYDPRALDRLWEAVPEGLRQSRMSALSVPEQYRGVFAEGEHARDVVDLGILPGLMRRELTWCLFRIIDLGGKVPVASAGMLTRRLSEVVADLDGRAPASLMEQPVRAWCEQISLAVYRRKGRLPGAGSIKGMRELLLRCVRLLEIACDLRPWWRREVWNAVEDPRIPVRQPRPGRVGTLPDLRDHLADQPDTVVPPLHAPRTRQPTPRRPRRTHPP